ncbi:hypothetical protein MTR67_031351, partial [Solanum verrucosum]
FVGSKKLNMQRLATGEQFYKGVRDCFSKTYMEAGIRGLLLWSWTSWSDFQLSFICRETPDAGTVTLLIYQQP